MKTSMKEDLAEIERLRKFVLEPIIKFNDLALQRKIKIQRKIQLPEWMQDQPDRCPRCDSVTEFDEDCMAYFCSDCDDYVEFLEKEKWDHEDEQ